MLRDTTSVTTMTEDNRTLRILTAAMEVGEEKRLAPKRRSQYTVAVVLNILHFSVVNIVRQLAVSRRTRQPCKLLHHKVIHAIDMSSSLCVGSTARVWCGLIIRADQVKLLAL